MATEISLQGRPTMPPLRALAPVRIGLSEAVRHRGVLGLNSLLAHTAALCDLYDNAHWHSSRATFYKLHLLFNRHYEEQVQLLDALAQRVRTLGGVAVTIPRDIAAASRLARAPRGREDPSRRLARLVEAHEVILLDARPTARRASDDGDEATNDLIVRQVVRANELQSWSVGEYLASPTPLREADHAC